MFPHPDLTIYSNCGLPVESVAFEYLELHGVRCIKDGPAELTLCAVIESICSNAEFCVNDALQHQALIERVLASGQHPVTAQFDTTKLDTLNPQHYFQASTSGSTGDVKRIRRQIKTWLHSFELHEQRFAITPADSYAVLGPLSYTLNLFAAIEACVLGADLHLLDGVQPRSQLQSIAQNNTSIIWSTPAKLNLLCRQLNTAHDTSNTRYIFSGGSKLDNTTRELVLEAFPTAELIEFYGAAETSFIAMSDSSTPSHSVGKLYPGVELRQIEGDAGINSTGEIWVNSPYLFSEYVDGDGRPDNQDINGERATSADTHNLQDTRYVSAGELGYLDEQGNLYLTGRTSRMVNISGMKVYPEVIEQRILEHDQVLSAVVLASQHPVSGSRLHALVELKHAENVDTDQFRGHLLKELRQTLGNTKAPRHLFFVSSIPHLVSGKPDFDRCATLLQSCLTSDPTTP